MEYYLAVDIGASSGRHILGHVEDGKAVIEEIYRFPNGMKEENGHKYWDTNELFGHILEGMKKCASAGKIPVSMGIDTWGVDYCLLDSTGEPCGPVYGYRDGRTAGMDGEVYKYISEGELYRRTGIQKQPFNTIYQLMAEKELTPDVLERAETMLLIPDYFNYLLTGEKVTEYTNASTTQLLVPETGEWDHELIGRLGYPGKIFTKIAKPGTRLGRLKESICDVVGFDTVVVLPATHDTGSAVVAVPSTDDDTLYISSGTWSLMGTELKKADTGEESRRHNFTNEGGFDFRFRYLKNIMGLWMINSAKKELAPDMSYDELCRAAAGESIPSVIPANDSRFLSPKSMSEEVRNACSESGQQVPKTPAQIAAVIYNSLAVCYAETLHEIEEMTGKHYDNVHVIGGGSNADYLNRITAKACQRTVYAGPSEATAIGNLLVQMIANGAVEDLGSARRLAAKSFGIKEYRSQ